MTKLALKDISDAMRHVDICMMTTKGSALESRPMSNNKDVEYQGDSYFFTDANTDVARALGADPSVNLAYIDAPAILGKTLYISVAGRADLVRDRAAMQAHWTSDLDAWFADGIDTPGLTMIHVKADSVKYWQARMRGK